MYHTSVAQKLLSREAARKFKDGSQRIHILRQKCRQRIHEARLTRFDGTRKIQETDHEDLIIKILYEEIDSNITLEDEVISDLRSEMFEWLLEQQEEESYYLAQLDENNMVFCPLCLKSCLDTCDSHFMQCQCGVKFKYNGTLSDLNSEIKSVFGKHEQICDESPNFFIEQHSNSLNVLCEACNYFYNFV